MTIMFSIFRPSDQKKPHDVASDSLSDPGTSLPPAPGAEQRDRLLDQIAEAIRRKREASTYEPWIQDLIESGMALDELETQIRLRLDWSKRWRRTLLPIGAGVGVAILLISLLLSWLVSKSVARQALANLPKTPTVATLQMATMTPTATNTPPPPQATPAPQGHWDIQVVHYRVAGSSESETLPVVIDVLVQDQAGTPAPDGLELTLGVDPALGTIKPQNPRTQGGIAHAILFAPTAITEANLQIRCDNDERQVNIPLVQPTPTETDVPSPPPEPENLTISISPDPLEMAIDEPVTISVAVIGQASQQPAPNVTVEFGMEPPELAEFEPPSATTDANGVVGNVRITPRDTGRGQLVAGAPDGEQATQAVTIWPVAKADATNTRNVRLKPREKESVEYQVAKTDRLVVQGQHKNNEGLWYLVATPRGDLLYIFAKNVSVSGKADWVPQVDDNQGKISSKPIPSSTPTPTGTNIPTPTPTANTSATATGTVTPTATDTPTPTNKPAPAQYEIKEETHLYAEAEDVESNDKTKTVIYRLPSGFKEIYPLGELKGNAIKVKIVVWTDMGNLATDPPRFIQSPVGKRIRITKDALPPDGDPDQQSLQDKASDYPVTVIEESEALRKVEVEGWMDLRMLTPIAKVAWVIPVQFRQT